MSSFFPKDIDPDSALAHRFRQMVEFSEDMFYEIDQHGRFSYFNPAAERLTGYPAEDLRACGFQHMIAPTWRERVLAFYADQMRRREPTSYLEFEICHREGHHRWIGQHVRLEYEDERAVRSYAIARDITERKNQEKALREQEKRYRLLSENAQDIVCLLDATGHLLYASPSVYEQLGYAPAELTGQEALTLVARRDAVRLRRTLRRAQTQGEETLNVEFRARRQDEAFCWLEANVKLIYERSELVSIHTVSRDISRRKVAERETRAQYQLLESVIDELPLCIFLKDKDSRMVRINDQTCQMHGKPRLEIVGRDNQALHLPETAAAIDATDAAAWRHELPATWEDEVAYPDGNRHFLKGKKPISYHPAYPPLLLGFAIDITRQKEAETALRYQQAFVRQAIDSLPNLIYVADTDGRTQLVNQALASYLRCAPADLVGLPLADVLPSYEDAEPWPERLAAVLQRGTTERFEESVTNPDGTAHFFETAWLPLPQPEGPPWLLGVSNDITGLKNKEKDLIAARQAAEAATEEKGRLISHLSHELRTPLNAIIGISQLMQDEALPPSARERLQTLDFSAQTLLKLLNDILDFHKMEARMVTLEVEPFQLEPLLDQLQKLFEPLAKANQTRLVLKADGLPKTVVGDQMRLSQVLSNLITNAVKFTRNGWVFVEASVQATDESGVTVAFEVSDTGVGMTPEQLDKLFVPFQQAEPGTARRYGGTGLGLSIVKELLTLHNSELRVESVPNEGTTFAFELYFPTVGRTATAAVPVPSSLVGRRVLLVEDNEVNALVARQFLTKWDASVDHVTDGESAVQACQSEKYDVVLLDLHLPDYSGNEVARRLRAAEDGRRVPIVAFSAAPKAEMLAAVRASDMDDYLSKPFDATEMRHKIASYASGGAPAELIDPEPLTTIPNADATFVQTLMESFQDIFTEFPPRYATTLAAGDQDGLQHLLHGFRSHVRFFKIDQLEVEMERGRTLLSEGATQAALTAQADRVSHLCARVRAELAALREAYAKPQANATG